MVTHEEWLEERILPWARTDANVRAVAMLGSRSHTAPADEWADMDLLLLVQDRAAILDTDDWLDDVGPHWVAVRHPGPFPGLGVRQVLFEHALDFDILPFAAGTFAERLTEPPVAELVAGGLVPLVDKDSELAAASLPQPTPPLTVADISQADYDFVVGDFLFQTVWAAKHLRRGELWAAKDDVDCYMKADLVQMLEWHAIAHHPGVSPRAGGRHLEEWADQRFVTAAPHLFATYEPASVASALLEMMDVFGWVSTETGAVLGFAYPAAAHDQLDAWVRDCLAPVG